MNAQPQHFDPDPLPDKVDSVVAVTHTLAQMRRIQEQIASFEERAQAERERVEWWLSNVTEALRNKLAAAESMLTTYHESQFDQDSKKISIKFPGGTLKSRGTKDLWQVSDEEAVVKWAKESRPELVKVTESLRKGDANKVFGAFKGKVIDTETGELIPGTDILPGSREYWVKVNDG